MDLETPLSAMGRQTGIAALMHSAYGWPTAEAVHFLALAVLLGSVGLFDLRALGLAKGIPMRAVHRLVPFGVAAYAVSVTTGSMFVVTSPGRYLPNPAFQLKLMFMLIAGINVLVFYGLVFRRVRDTGPGETAPAAVRIIAAVSLASWLAVIICGRLITVFRPFGAG